MLHAGWSGFQISLHFHDQHKRYLNGHLIFKFHGFWVLFSPNLMTGAKFIIEETKLMTHEIC